MRISDWSSDVCSSDLTLQALELAKTDAPPRLDGKADDEAWRAATAATVETHNGQNLPQGSTPVRVRGLHDGEFAYLLFEWPDATRSQKHLPLQKTESGWRVLQSDYARQDENVFYEDKFRSEEHTSELQSLMRISYAVLCLKKKK